MALVLDDAAADALSAVICARLTDGYLELYDATPTLLLRLRLPLTAFVADAVNGGQVLSGSWFGSAVATGTAATFRLSSHDAALSVAGTVSEEGGGGDLIVSDTALVYGQLVEVTACHITFRS